jgi:hypothetical protein
LSYILKKKYVFIPRSFLVINVCNQGKTLWPPCILPKWWLQVSTHTNNSETLVFRWVGKASLLRWWSLDREADEWAILNLLKFVFSPADSFASQNTVFLITAVCLRQIIRSLSSKPEEASVLKISEKSRRRQITVLWKLSVSTDCRDVIHLLSLLHNECENICWSPKYARCLKFNSGRRQKIEKISFWGMMWKLEREVELWAVRSRQDASHLQQQISNFAYSVLV